MIITMEGEVTVSVDTTFTDIEEVTKCISLMLQMQGWDKDTVSTYIGQDLECVSKEEYELAQEEYRILKMKFDNAIAELFELRNTSTNIHTEK